MIEDINVIINLDSIKMSKSGAITGEIFFEVSNKFFPEENWSDFIVVILGWWVNNLRNYYQRREDCFELCFMDGPLSIKVKNKEEDTIELSFMRITGDEQQIFFKAECYKEVLKKRILSAARKILRKAEIEQWYSDSFDGLKKGVVCLEYYK